MKIYKDKILITVILAIILILSILSYAFAWWVAEADIPEWVKFWLLS